MTHIGAVTQVILFIIVVIVIIAIFNRWYETEHERESNRGKLWLAVIVALVVVLAGASSYNKRGRHEHHRHHSRHHHSHHERSEGEYRSEHGFGSKKNAPVTVAKTSRFSLFSKKAPEAAPAKRSPMISQSYVSRSAIPTTQKTDPSKIHRTFQPL